MAVELMMGYEGDRGGGGSGGREGTVEEAALAGLRSMERLIGLLSQHCHEQQQQQELELEVGCQAAVAAVTKFRKVISLLGRTRTGHARFRRAPPPVVAVAPPPHLESPPVAAREREKKIKEEAAEAPEAEEGPVKVYCPKPIQQRLPPLPHHHHQRVFPAASAAAISRTSSLMSADTASTSSFRPRGAAAASSTAAVVAARPPPSSSSSLQLKRKCGSRSEDGAALCSVSAGGSGKCHCTKRRLNRIKENRIPPMRPTLTWRSRSAPPPPPPLDYMLVLCDLISWALFDDRNQEAAAEEDGEGAGDKREDGRHPAGRFLLAQVRPETHQGLALPQGVLQMQQRAGVPGEEARGEGPGRPRHARRHLRGRARPPRRPPPGRRRPVAPGGGAEGGGRRRITTP